MSGEPSSSQILKRMRKEVRDDIDWNYDSWGLRLREKVSKVEKKRGGRERGGGIW